jgi:hypothetical protein
MTKQRSPPQASETLPLVPQKFERQSLSSTHRAPSGRGCDFFFFFFFFFFASKVSAIPSAARAPIPPADIPTLRRDSRDPRIRVQPSKTPPSMGFLLSV